MKHQSTSKESIVIISKIVGGIGNQMFQYAFGRSLAVSTAQDYRLDLSEMNKYKLRGYQLDQLQIQAKSLKKWEYKLRKHYSSSPLVRTLVSAAKCIDIEENGLPFDQKIKNLKGPIGLSGYWQTEKYFQDIAGIIRAEFQLKSDYTPERQSSLLKIRSSTAPVSIHVRRGDYVSQAKTNEMHGTCEPDWYAAAMAQMANGVNSPDFFVFSDDIPWAKQNLPSYPTMTFIEPQSDGKDVQDIHLMASCTSHITANSSFSWWGAWLNPKPDKHVIAPAQWFRSPDLDGRDVVPSDWQRL